MRVLADAPAVAAREVARWDGRDALGRALPAGVYFTRLVAGDAEVSGRVEFLK